ncbi:hypothetical protein ACMAZF_17365 [Psychrobium sp. nBUS_13]|jgi:hypothetical protein|uniref:hypothetical protein n=1 Tax=Psychrobium sp. nBUS_13 TaxID=3395319 RepID=UPI003EB78D05
MFTNEHLDSALFHSIPRFEVSILLGNHCKLAQGYLYSKPLTASDATAFLGNKASMFI